MVAGPLARSGCPVAVTWSAIPFMPLSHRLFFPPADMTLVPSEDKDSKPCRWHRSLRRPQELMGHSWPPLIRNRPGRLEPFFRNAIGRDKSVHEPIVRRPAHPLRLVG